MFGTIFHPEKFRMAVKVIDKKGDFLTCQGLSMLSPIKVHKDYFYLQGHPIGMLALEQQILSYLSLSDETRTKAFQDIELLDFTKTNSEKAC